MQTNQLRKIASTYIWIIKDAKNEFENINYHKVANSNMSCLEAYAGLSKLLMKGIFYPNVLWPLDKKLIFLLVTHVSTCNFTVVKDILKMMLQTPMTLFYSTVVALWILHKPVALHDSRLRETEQRSWTSKHTRKTLRRSTAVIR